MQFLKSLVIGLGVLIAVGLGLLAWGFYHKARDPGWRMFSSQPAAGGSAPAAFGTLGLDLPKECYIEAIDPDGERLYVTVGPIDDACARVVVVDVARGRVLGVIKPGK